MRRKEQKKNCYKLTVTPHPPLRGLWGEEKTEESGVKLILEKGKQ